MNADSSPRKADFAAIYDQPDPRAYFRTLEPYDYRIPRYGVEAFARLLAARSDAGDGRQLVLDVCCSYGIVGALLRTGLSLDDLYGHYRSPALDALSADEQAATDRRLLATHALPSPPRVIGLDVAAPAVAYAVDVGAMDAGFSDDLEQDDPSPALRAALGDVDLVTTTGGVGYVTARTFARLLEGCRNARPTTWFATFCLRTYDYGPIAATLDGYGLRTERLSRTFPQRRFIDDTEQRWAISRVTERGIDPAGKETSGYYHADLFVSRPATDIAASPVDDLLADLL